MPTNYFDENVAERYDESTTKAEASAVRAQRKLPIRAPRGRNRHGCAEKT